MNERELFPVIAFAASLSVAVLWFLDSDIDWFVFAGASVFVGFMASTFYAIGAE